MCDSRGYRAGHKRAPGTGHAALRWLAVLGLFVFLGVPTLYAQERISVKGKVTDTGGEPLIGVTVMVKGNTSQVAVTDTDGLYVIDAPADGVLEFSLVGMKKVEAPVNGRGVVDVVLADDNVLLDELVVVGFGSQKKENLTGAVYLELRIKVLKDWRNSDRALRQFGYEVSD